MILSVPIETACETHKTASHYSDGFAAPNAGVCRGRSGPAGRLGRFRGPTTDGSVTGPEFSVRVKLRTAVGSLFRPGQRARLFRYGPGVGSPARPKTEHSTPPTFLTRPNSLRPLPRARRRFMPLPWLPFTNPRTCTPRPSPPCVKGRILRRSNSITNRPISIGLR